MPKSPGKENGGATLFASGHELYDALPADLRARADAATVRYISDGNWQHVYDMNDRGTRRTNKPGEVETSWDHELSLVVTHPVTGRRALWTAPANVQGPDGAQDLVQACLDAAVARVPLLACARRADMSLMNRGDAAAATWLFRGTKSHGSSDENAAGTPTADCGTRLTGSISLPRPATAEISSLT